MAQVIVIEPNQKLSDLICLQLKHNFNIEVIPRTNSEDAIDILKILPEIDLIISRHLIENEPTADFIDQFIKSNNLNTHLIVLAEKSSSFYSKDVEVVVDPNKNWKEVLVKTAHLLNISTDWQKKKQSPMFIPIPIHYFLHLDSCCSDAYIRIKKTPTEFQFIKRIHKNDSFPTSTIARYIAQGLESFYISKEDKKYFTNFLSDKLCIKLNSNLEPSEQIELIDHSYKIAKDEISQYGFNSSTIQLTESILSAMINLVNADILISTLIAKILNSKTSYLYQLSHLTSLIGIKILQAINKDSKKDQAKIVHTSFFCDMTLSDDQDLATIMTYSQLENELLTEEQWDQVFNHSFEASILYQKFSEGIQGVSEIIKQHHGAVNGKGYGTNNISKLSQITKIYILAYEFTSNLLEIKVNKSKISPIIQRFKTKYQDPQMLQAILALEAILKQMKKNVQHKNKNKK